MHSFFFQKSASINQIVRVLSRLSSSSLGFVGNTLEYGSFVTE